MPRLMPGWMPRPRSSTRVGLVAALLAGTVGTTWLVLAPDPTDVPDLPRADAAPVAPAVPVAEVAAEEPERARRLTGPLRGAGAPMRIRVPSLDVDAPVVPISGESGVLEPPVDAALLGWWQEGPVPGAGVGSAVLTGHTLSAGDGALDELGTLRRGDLLWVATEAGTVRYEVRRTRVLSKAELAAQAVEIFDLEQDPRLVLITCDDWNGSEYLSNAVVNAVPVGSRGRVG